MFPAVALCVPARRILTRHPVRGLDVLAGFEPASAVLQTAD
ncbi:hypothetical protein ARTHRO9AX_130094 [Arthrobacter sp. 9AX]|nr:hypothetical protein ARTHRO9AX_130094 [Arthrobacter sp. 9AX]